MVSGTHIRPFFLARVLLLLSLVLSALLGVLQTDEVIGQAPDPPVEPGPREIQLPSGEVRVVPVPDPPSDSSYLGTPLCSDGWDSSCGPFQWTVPPAANQPLQVRVSKTSYSARVGEPVELDVIATDPDQRIDRNCIGVGYGDGRSEPGTCKRFVCLQPFGSWEPPRKESDQLRRVFEHSYRRTGSYQVSLWFQSKTEACDHPFASTGTATITVTVR